jgi:hypothetical protein
MRSDGQITANTKQKSNIPNSVSPYSTNTKQNKPIKNIKKKDKNPT